MPDLSSPEGERPSGASVAAREELQALDAKMERVRRRLYAVDTGLLAVPDREAELAALEREFAELGERFRAAYRKWQLAERSEFDATSDS